ncbi:MAG: type II toxin-antitoxin system MqsA family antitoxin [Acidobacteriota bacterium]|nr:type II toxin-antitoxin system MqsA family antitoxin [Acidobacteriota bacterium]
MPANKTIEMKPRARKPKTGACRICSFCGQQSAREVLMPQAYGKDTALFVIENVPTVICDNCGESYFTGSTLEELERILSNQNEVAKARPVPVAQFKMAA